MTAKELNIHICNSCGDKLRDKKAVLCAKCRAELDKKNI